MVLRALVRLRFPSGVTSFNKIKNFIGPLSWVGMGGPGGLEWCCQVCFPCHLSAVLLSESLCVRLTLTLVKRLQTGTKLHNLKKERERERERPFSV